MLQLTKHRSPGPRRVWATIAAPHPSPHPVTSTLRHRGSNFPQPHRPLPRTEPPPRSQTATPSLLTRSPPSALTPPLTATTTLPPQCDFLAVTRTPVPPATSVPVPRDSTPRSPGPLTSSMRRRRRLGGSKAAAGPRAQQRHRDPSTALAMATGAPRAPAARHVSAAARDAREGRRRGQDGGLHRRDRQGGGAGPGASGGVWGA